MAYDIIDSHFHFFDFDRFKYEWPRPDEEKVIYRNFLPQDYKEMKDTKITKAVFVEAHESLEETKWVLQLAETTDFIAGAVVYVNILSPTLAQDLKQLKQYRKFVGFRKILDFSENDWLIRDDVIKGLKILADHQLTFDLLIKSPEQYDTARKFMQLMPKHLKVVVDHLGKPDSRNGASQQWFDDIKMFASYPNVYCKLSGMVTEADPTNWKPGDFSAHVNYVIGKFGIDRVMFGSDWPVCKLASANLPTVLDLLQDLLKDFPVQDKRKVFFLNAKKFYNLDVSSG